MSGINTYPRKGQYEEAITKQICNSGEDSSNLKLIEDVTNNIYHSEIKKHNP